ncbi:MAG: sensor histidine kinase [Pirellulales bacterium]
MSIIYPERPDVRSQNDQDECLRLRKLLAIYQRDRQLLAFEIHDGLIQTLTAAALHLEATRVAADALPPEAHKQLEVGLGLLREGISEGRRFISGLRPPVLDEDGLRAALEHLAARLAAEMRLPIEIDCRAGLEELAPLVELTLYRVVQEALTNIRRHSAATQVRVELRRVDGRVRAVIADNGIGFDPAQSGLRNFGLRGMRERVRVLGGDLNIESEPGQGTRIVVDLPAWLPDEGVGD